MVLEVQLEVLSGGSQLLLGVVVVNRRLVVPLLGNGRILEADLAAVVRGDSRIGQRIVLLLTQRELNDRQQAYQSQSLHFESRICGHTKLLNAGGVAGRKSCGSSPKVTATYFVIGV